MNEVTVTKTGTIAQTPMKSHKSVKVDFGGHTEWFPLELFQKNLIRAEKGVRVKMEFTTCVSGIEYNR